MKSEYLNILSNQFCSSWQMATGNKYSDPRLQDFHDTMNKCESYLRSVYWNGGVNDLAEYCVFRFLNNFCRWINVLNMNVEGRSHNELVKCLSAVVDEWIESAEAVKHIVCLSEGEYSYRNPFDKLKVEQSIVKNQYGADLNYQLVDIMMPTHLMDDFMYNSILFHEIGHFIIRYHEYMDKIEDKLKSDVFSDKTKTDEMIKDSFPYLVKTGFDEGRDKAKLLSHVEEYAADIFGAQYVGIYILPHLEIHCDRRRTKEDAEHPCYERREKMVKDFLDSKTDNILLNVIKDVFNEQKHGSLTIRYEDLDKTYFEKGQLYPISTNKQLISLFKLSWELYVDNNNSKKEKPIDYFTRLTKWAKDSVNNYIK